MDHLMYDNSMVINSSFFSSFKREEKKENEIDKPFSTTFLKDPIDFPQKMSSKIERSTFMDDFLIK